MVKGRGEMLAFTVEPKDMELVTNCIVEHLTHNQEIYSARQIGCKLL